MAKKKDTTKSKKPADNDLAQQRVPAWPPNFPSIYFGIIWIILGIIIIPIGTSLRSKAEDTYESKITYDNGSGGDCYITAANEGKQCQVTFTFNEDVTGPIYLYYELENFFQNHRRYYQSLSRGQLKGERLSESDVSLACTPLYKNGSQLLNPCGLIANSYFTDVITLDSYHSSPANLYLDEKGISLHTDRKDLYKQVDTFDYRNITADPTLTCIDVGLDPSCQSYYDASTNTYYLYYYPDDSSTQYLHETYPGLISPIEGVTNEHFIVWMKTPLMPSFRKLYGKIHSDFNAGDTLVFNMTANYVTETFDATKKLVISNLGDLGGRNDFPAVAYKTIGSMALIFGVFLIVKEKVFGSHI